MSYSCAKKLSATVMTHFSLIVLSSDEGKGLANDGGKGLANDEGKGLANVYRWDNSSMISHNETFIYSLDKRPSIYSDTYAIVQPRQNNEQYFHQHGLWIFVSNKMTSRSAI